MGAENSSVLAFPTKRKRPYATQYLRAGDERPANLVILRLPRPAPRPDSQTPPFQPNDYLLQAILGALSQEQRAQVELQCADWAHQFPKSSGIHWAWRGAKAALDRWPEED